MSKTVMPPSPTNITRNTIAVLLVMLLGGVLRLMLVTRVDFPLNDGGFFYASIDQLLQNGFRLPATVTYNALNIPYAHPPLAFYLVAGLQALSGLETLTLMRFVPVLMSSLTLIPAFLLMRAALTSARQIWLGMLVMAFAPNALNGFIGGGGVVAATGQFFGMWAAFCLYQLTRTQRRVYIVPSALAIAAAYLSQTQWGAFSVVTFLALYISSERSIKLTLSTLATAALALGLLAPWLYSVVQLHGVEPFVSVLFGAWTLHHPFGMLFQTSFTQEPLLAVFAGLSFLSLFVGVALDRAGLVVWTLLLMLLLPDAAASVSLVPLALCVALTLDYLLLMGLSSFRQRERRGWLRGDWAVVAGYLSVAMLFLFPALSIYANSDLIGSPLRAVPAVELAAMRWVERETPPESVVLVVTGRRAPTTDAVSDWFPIVAQRPSPSTIQGTVWFGENDVAAQLERYTTLQACANQRVICIEQWALNNNASFTHVYLSPEVTGILKPSLTTTADFEQVYDRNGVLIFARRSATG